MPKKVKELSSTEVRRLTWGTVQSEDKATRRKVGDPRPAYHAVGGVAGLHLQIRPPESKNSEPSKSWVLRVTVGAKRRDIGLGGFPDVTLAQARDKAREMKEKIAQGIDPVEERLSIKRALTAAQVKADIKGMTFEQAAHQCHAKKKSEFKNPKHADQWINTLTTYAFPIIGKLPVELIEISHIHKLLAPIWEVKSETANRVRGRIESVLDWATVQKIRTGENPARWSGNLSHLLPKLAKVQNKQHQPTLHWKEAPQFMEALRERKGAGAKALEFLCLTASRSGEVRNATWEQFDFDAKLWTIPAEVMKMSRAHIVPLSQAMIDLLRTLPRLHGSDYVFTSTKGGALSDMTISKLIKDMHETELNNGGKGWVDPVTGKITTPHGLRSTFKDWARVNTDFADEVTELALAHVNNDATRAAYARDGLVEKRRELMKQWNEYLNGGI